MDAIQVKFYNHSNQKSDIDSFPR
ncbi:hypothetical protein [Streptococcus parasanguinis]